MSDDTEIGKHFKRYIARLQYQEYVYWFQANATSPLDALHQMLSRENTQDTTGISIEDFNGLLKCLDNIEILEIDIKGVFWITCSLGLSDVNIDIIEACPESSFSDLPTTH